MRLVTAALVLAACSKPAPSPAPDPAPMRPPPVASVRAEVPAPVSIAIASFGARDTLDECDDIVATAKPEGPAFDRKRLEAKVGKEKGRQVLTKACEEALQGTPTIATCTTDPQTIDAGITVAITARYYDRASIERNGYMRQCLKAGGSWWAAP